MKKILLIDDDKDFCKITYSIVNKFDAEISIVNKLRDAIILILRQKFDLIMIDGYLPDGSGVDFVIYLHKKKIRSKILFVSGGYTTTEQFKWLKSDIGVDFVINKPIAPVEMYSILKSIFNQNKDSKLDELLVDLKKDYDATIFEKLEKLENLLKILNEQKTIKNLEAFRKEIHKITGTAGSYGYEDVTKSGRQCDQDILKRIENKEEIKKEHIDEYVKVIKKFKLGFQNISLVNFEDKSLDKEIKKKRKDYKTRIEILIFSEDVEIIQSINHSLKESLIRYKVFSEKNRFLSTLEKVRVKIILISKEFYDQNYNLIFNLRKENKTSVGIFVSELENNWMIENLFKGFDFVISKNDEPAYIKEFLQLELEKFKIHRYRVIVVDGDPITLKYISNVLIEIVADVKELATPESLFSLLPIYTPDLIILDLDFNDQKYNPINVIKMLKSNIYFSNVPIITTSSNVKEFNVTELLNLGIELNLEKPIVKDKFKAEINNFFYRRNTKEFYSCTNFRTGLLNSFSFQKIFAKIKNTTIREKKVFALGLVEFQNLDKIEEKYGFAKRIKAVDGFAKLLLNNFRSSDLIGHFDDNILIIVLKDQTAIFLQFVLGRFFDELQTSDIFKEIECIQIGLKAGISEFPKFGKSLNHLISLSEKALVAAKNDEKSVIKIAEFSDEALINNQEICLVDDDVDLTNMLKYSFSTRGYKVCSYNKGKDFIDEIKTRSGLELPKLIILDRELPDYDGMDIFKILKEELKINVPVLFLSSKSTEKDIYRALEAGAVDYVTKPFSLKILLQKTLNLIISTSDV
jgi:diguanylate cyclase (GGDEF)-like protein